MSALTARLYLTHHCLLRGPPFLADSHETTREFGQMEAVAVKGASLHLVDPLHMASAPQVEVQAALGLLVVVVVVVVHVLVVVVVVVGLDVVFQTVTVVVASVVVLFRVGSVVAVVVQTGHQPHLTCLFPPASACLCKNMYGHLLSICLGPAMHTLNHIIN